MHISLIKNITNYKLIKNFLNNYKLNILDSWIFFLTFEWIQVKIFKQKIKSKTIMVSRILEYVSKYLSIIINKYFWIVLSCLLNYQWNIIWSWKYIKAILSIGDATGRILFYMGIDIQYVIIKFITIIKNINSCNINFTSLGLLQIGME